MLPHDGSPGSPARGVTTEAPRPGARRQRPLVAPPDPVAALDAVDGAALTNPSHGPPGSADATPGPPGLPRCRTRLRPARARTRPIPPRRPTARASPRSARRRVLAPSAGIMASRSPRAPRRAPRRPGRHVRARVAAIELALALERPEPVVAHVDEVIRQQESGVSPLPPATIGLPSSAKGLRGAASWAPARSLSGPLGLRRRALGA
jgi:hypothetical protein